MSSVLPPVALPTRSRPALPGWTREPLLHFLLLGALLFGVDHAVNRRAGDADEIVISAEVDDEARQLFKATRNRDPNAEEMAALRKVWLDNEVLYREGLALQLDKGDTAIRERVIFKALSVVDSGTKLPAADDKLLRAWFEQHRAKYDEPARFDFQEAVLPGEPGEAAVRAFVDSLNNGAPGDAKAGLRVFKGRPHANLLQSYGEDFAKALEAAAPGSWLALKSRDGWRAVRLDAASTARPASFENLRGVVLQDWTDATLAEQRSAAVAALAKKYVVKVEAASK
ncbi:peptidyl-prolyl cis-trans isomerase [Pelomonas sp. P7]|uniref:Peptidyl-prolyl cis-trans isomerase n=1 Tax=Pelomonas caseinilytica TaxID=2906763 RepID=A0ABS8XI63_9BURK|nr:peptidylprolyl isomerase [Pelomonas sp. P7]MCE4539242.1 peptidyl-prolyl cis-trans isomerase [Pelomonas sp. P7]